MNVRTLARLGLVAVAGAIGVTRVVEELRRGQRAIADRLRSGSHVVETPHGPVEYASVGEGPAVLVAHGAGGGYDQGLIVARAIDEPKFRFVAISRPGYLRTPLEIGPTPEAQADICAELLDVLGIARAAIIGVSAGGLCALQFALRHPGRCWALLLLSACSQRHDVQPGLPYLAAKALSVTDAGVQAVRAVAERSLEIDGRRSIHNREVRARVISDPDKAPLLRESVLAAYCQPKLRFAGYDNDVAQVRSAGDYPLDQITVPTLVVHGNADPAVPLSHAEHVASRVAGADLLVVDGGEHLCLVSHLEIVRPRMIDFLRTHAPYATQMEGAR